MRPVSFIGLDGTAMPTQKFMRRVIVMQAGGSRKSATSLASIAFRGAIGRDACHYKISQ